MDDDGDGGMDDGEEYEDTSWTHLLGAKVRNRGVWAESDDWGMGAQVRRMVLPSSGMRKSVVVGVLGAARARRAEGVEMVRRPIVSLSFSSVFSSVFSYF